MHHTLRHLKTLRHSLLAIIAILLSHPFTGRSQATTASNSVPYLTAQEEAKTFVCEDGYKMELVLSDPEIVEPVLTVFDGNGRMFVAEMRSYMQDADGKDQTLHNGRVSVHWSSKKDGVYDKHAVFADNLYLPRIILPLYDGVIINETDTDDFYYYRDT